MYSILTRPGLVETHRGIDRTDILTDQPARPFSRDRTHQTDPHWENKEEDKTKKEKKKKNWHRSPARREPAARSPRQPNLAAGERTTV